MGERPHGLPPRSYIAYYSRKKMAVVIEASRFVPGYTAAHAPTPLEALEYLRDDLYSKSRDLNDQIGAVQKVIEEAQGHAD